MTTQRPLVGRPAPDIALPNRHGELWRLSEHRGRTVVVVFHRHIH